MNWVMTYELVCGCTVAHVRTNDKGKLAYGDYWHCHEHGDQTIKRASGVGA